MCQVDKGLGERAVLIYGTRQIKLILGIYYFEILSKEISRGTDTVWEMCSECDLKGNPLIIEDFKSPVLFKYISFSALFYFG